MQHRQNVMLNRLLYCLFWMFCFPRVTSAAELPLKFTDIVREEMRALDDASGFVSRISIENDDFGIQSCVGSGIVFSLPTLERIRHNFNIKQSRWLIRFLLAHEKAHQLQFRQYPIDKINSTNAISNRVKECQADLLAAKYCAMSADEGFGDQTTKDNFETAILEIFQYIFGLGNEDPLAGYPNPQARRTAARLGLSRGQVEKFRNLPQEVPQFASATRHLEIILDIRANENVLDWSLRQARRIVHFDNQACESLVLEKWDTKRIDLGDDVGAVKYTIAYRNAGKRLLYVEMEVQCITSDEADPDNTLKWQKWSVRNYEFPVKPGEKFLVEGRLDWRASKTLSKPRIIFPIKDDRALYSCRFVDSIGP